MALKKGSKLLEELLLTNQALLGRDGAVNWLSQKLKLWVRGKISDKEFTYEVETQLKSFKVRLEALDKCRIEEIQ